MEALYFGLTLAGIVGVSIFGILLFAWGWTNGRNDTRKEAIKHNAAHWTITPDGTPVFKWKGDPDSE